MTHFRNLEDTCRLFEDELRKVSPQLYTAKPGQSFEDGIAKKMQELSLFTAKLRLLEASMTLEPTQNLKQEDVMAAYEDAAAWKVLEQQTVKAVSQARDVRNLITTPDQDLGPELLNRKINIISSLKEFRLKEEELRETDAILQQKEAELAVLRAQWDRELAELRNMRVEAGTVEDQVEIEGPVNALKTLIEKMEMMRWLINRLVTARADGYDWLKDPDNRFAALVLAREPNNLQSYLYSE